MIPINAVTVSMSEMNRDVSSMQRVKYKFVNGMIIAVIMNGTSFALKVQIHYAVTQVLM